MTIRIPWAKPVFGGTEREYLVASLDSTWISGGAFVERFEQELVRRLGAPFAVTTSNGTTALHLALLGCGIGPGDEVIVPGFTFVAPANMVISVGATPVYADVDPDTWCVNPEEVERRVTNRTKALIPVHVYGNVCNMDDLRTIRDRHRIFMIEDAAEASFSKYRGRAAGTFGDAGCFSFQATKTITTGEGGCVLASDADLCERMRLIRDHGMRKVKRYWHDAVGFNFRLTNLQAALGCGQLDHLDSILDARRELYRTYRERLAGEAGIAMQRFPPEVEPAVWALGLRVDSRYFKGDRDFLIEKLMDAGIETRPGFYPFSAMPIYNAPRLPNSEATGANVICLPFYPSLTTDDAHYICDRLIQLKR